MMFKTTASPSRFSNGSTSYSAIMLLRALILSALLPGVLADCFIDADGFERCNDGLSNAARIGIGIAGAVLLIAALGIMQCIRRRRLQKYYLSYLPPQGAPPVQPQPYYAGYAEYQNNQYGGYRGGQQQEPSPQVVGVYSMYSVHVASEGSPGPRYPPDVYSGGGAPPPKS
ncbi:hypothetical protein SCHPADRAFT_1001874 [Schizopora paradoxa]|uniref:Mid2 domain-containing protein n=1 Tax=Schizopora paradoxa TaxID=27342 RepID=A0A0H2R5U1_9AGAM|nr:hypothetical protein SCHPADRAFT_1001874 [Schizopora paradoxa]